MSPGTLRQSHSRRPPPVASLGNLSSSSAKEGIPKDLLTDQGILFISMLMSDLCLLLQLKKIRTSVHHPQTDGLVERFNQTLKRMLRQLVDKEGRNWDLFLPYALFAVHRTPQVSTGFILFKFLFRRRPQGLLDMAKPSPQHKTQDCVQHFQ